MKLYLKYREEADKFKNLLLVGRLAEYRYYDMDDVVKRALDVFEERIK
jgi:UDP-galactopyranose mutase